MYMCNYACDVWYLAWACEGRLSLQWLNSGFFCLCLCIVLFVSVFTFSFVCLPPPHSLSLASLPPSLALSLNSSSPSLPHIWSLLTFIHAVSVFIFIHFVCVYYHFSLFERCWPFLLAYTCIVSDYCMYMYINIPVEVGECKWCHWREGGVQCYQYKGELRPQRE